MLRSRPHRRLAIVVFLMALLLPAALSWAPVVGTLESKIISPPAGGPSNGPSDHTTYQETRPGLTRTDPIGAARPEDHNVTFSMDNRTVKYLAYESAATDLVSGDTNGKRDVFVMLRRTRFGGTLSRQSVNSNERQANGDSIKPSLDGFPYPKSYKGPRPGPRCLVFQSKATNLDSDDGSSDWDIFLRDLSSRTTKLVSVGKTNATNGVVDGRCRTVSFEAGGKVYVRDLKDDRTIQIATGRNPDQAINGGGVAYDRGGQVYWQAIDGAGDDLDETGGEKLVSNSASNARQGGNGTSTDPNVDFNGWHIVFESKATNLCTGRCSLSTDRNGPISDVFRRTMSDESPTGNRNSMEIVSYDKEADLQPDADSDQVHITAYGEQACFRSFGRNAREAKFSGGTQPYEGPIMHIYFWNYPRERGYGTFSGESKAGQTGEFTYAPGGSGDPALNWSCGISARGNYLGFTSAEEGESGESNGRAIGDAFMRFMGGSDE
jgi:hypothetical protein